MSHLPGGPPAPAIHGTPDRWLVLALVSCDYLIHYAHRNMIGFLQAPLKAGLHLSDQEYGWLQPAWNVPYAVAQIGVGYLGDRFARRSVLLWSLLGSSVAMALMGLSRTFEEMFACRVLLGLLQAPSVPAIASAVGDSFTPRGRSTAVGLYLISYNLGLILAGRYSGWIADQPAWRIPLAAVGGTDVEVAGWRLALLLCGVVGAVGLLLIALAFREPPRSEQGAGQAGKVAFPSALAAILRVRTYWFLAAAYVLSVVAVLAIQFWLPGYLRQRFTLNQEAANTQATVWIQSATVAGLLLGGRLADRLAQRRMNGRVAVQILGLSLVCPSLLLIGTGNSLPLLALPMLAFGLGTGLYQSNLWTSTFDVIDPATRSTAIGFLNVASGVSSFWCQPLIGQFAQAGGDLGTALAALSVPVFLALAALVIAGTVLLPRDYRGPLRPVS